ncbi:RING-type E3 ubiquitin transferase [Psidium guajava]|nr:RING-type E3 ubiquitin transferase [Psidium guajava]
MSHLQDLQSSGAQIQFVVESSPSQGRGGGGFRLPANVGDYFMGPGLEQLIQQLAENDPNRHGTPPASKSAVENLPTIKVSEELQNSEMNQCAVCLDDFEMDMEVKQMPCKHIYHADCLLPWLELHNSCPVCRHELLTDDPDYENRRRAAQGNAQGGGSGTSSGGGESRTVRRSFSITLPYPLRGNDGSNSASGGE